MELYRHDSRMQMKQNRKDGVEYLTFPLLEQTGMVRHLFSTRVGGVSKVARSKELAKARYEKRKQDKREFTARKKAGLLTPEEQEAEEKRLAHNRE